MDAADAAPLRPSPRCGRSTQQASAHRGAVGRVLMSRPAEAERCFPCHSPTLRPWIADRRLRTLRAVAVLRGGALEPEPQTLRSEKAHAKANANCQRVFPARALRVFLSQAGPRFDLELSQAEHHLLGFVRGVIAFGQQKRRPGWVALVWLAMRLEDLARIPPSEGEDVTGPALRIEAVPARQRPTRLTAASARNVWVLRLGQHRDVGCCRVGE